MTIVIIVFFYFFPVKFYSQFFLVLNLADADFFLQRMGDRTKCYFCKVTVRGWKWIMDPIKVHFHSNPNCGFIKKKMEDKNRREDENIKLEFLLCKVCHVAKMDCIYVECRHISSCLDCANQGRTYHERNMAQCPICRREGDFVKCFVVV